MAKSSDSLKEQGTEALVHVVNKVYEDALRPAVKQVGTALETLTGTVNMLLAPLHRRVLNWQDLQERFVPRVAEHLRDIPQERLREPPMYIAGPMMEAVRFTTDAESELRDMYAKLLASSMDTETASTVHPSFVSIIKQLTPDEAKIVRHLCKPGDEVVPVLSVHSQTSGGAGFNVIAHNVSLVASDAGCEFPKRCGQYIDNLNRLGITEIPEAQLSDMSGYDRTLGHPIVQAAIKMIEGAGRSHEFEYRVLRSTTLGKTFWTACIGEGAGVASEGRPIIEGDAQQSDEDGGG